MVCLTCRNCSGFTSPLAIELRCDAIVSRLVIRTGIRLGNVNGVLGESVKLVGNEKGWCGPWCRCWSVVILLIGEQDLSDVASRSCADTHFPPEKTPGYTLSEIGFY